MVEEYGTLVWQAGDEEFVAEEQQVGCKSHIVNISSQKMTKTYSQTSHFDPKNPDVHHPETRDEVGIIRAITVKVSSPMVENNVIVAHISQEGSSSSHH